MVADAVSRVLAGVGIHTEWEVTVAGKERPADLLAHGISSSAPVALDVTVVHTLSNFDTGRNSSRVSDAEKEKHEHYDAVCASAGISFKAFGISRTFGGAGPDANETMNTISSKIVSKSGKQEGDILARAALERIIVACMSGVGAQLLSTCIWKKTIQTRSSGQKSQKNPATKWQSTNHANSKIAPWTQSTTPARLPQAAMTKLTPCGVYTDSVEKFRRPTHPPF